MKIPHVIAHLRSAFIEHGNLDVAIVSEQREYGEVEVHAPGDGIDADAGRQFGIQEYIYVEDGDAYGRKVLKIHV